MEQRLAKTLLPLVNSPDHYEILTDYCKYQIEIRRNQLESATNIDQVNIAKGAIHELRYIMAMRDDVNRDAKNGG